MIISLGELIGLYVMYDTLWYKSVASPFPKGHASPFQKVMQDDATWRTGDSGHMGVLNDPFTTFFNRILVAAAVTSF